MGFYYYTVNFAVSRILQTINNEFYRVTDSAVNFVLRKFEHALNLFAITDFGRRFNWCFGVIALLCLICALVVVCSYLYHKKSWQCKFDQMSINNATIKKELDELSIREVEQIHTIESLVEENEHFKEEIFTLVEKLTTLEREEDTMSNLQEKHIQAKRSMYLRLKNLCYQYFVSEKSSKIGKNLLYSEVKSLFRILEDSSQKNLEQSLDENMDGVMSRLRSDLPELTESDLRIIALCILTLDAKTIARITGYSVSTIYNKRYYLREKILSLSNEEKEFFLKVIF